MHLHLNTCTYVAYKKPLQEEELTVSPDVSLCFDHVWTEPAAISRNNFGKDEVEYIAAKFLRLEALWRVSSTRKCFVRRIKE